MKKKTSILAAAFLLPLVAFAADAPSNSAGRDVLSAIWARGDKCVRVSDFKKIDGQSSEVFGVRYYVMDYEAQLTFTAPCYAEYDTERKRFSLAPRLTKDFLTQNSKMFQPGEAVIIQGSLHFDKKESGWHHKSGIREGNKKAATAKRKVPTVEEIFETKSKTRF
jgi:hypothetical protein